MGTLTGKSMQCPKCADEGRDTAKDNFSEYVDKNNKKSWHCHACGYDEQSSIHLLDNVSNKEEEYKKRNLFKEIKEGIEEFSVVKDSEFISGEYQDLIKRKLTQKTCKFCNIKVGKYTGYLGSGENKRYLQEESVIIYEYFRQGQLVAQKIKSHDKLMKLIGQGKNLSLFMQDKWTVSNKLPIIITEGEDDAASIAQAQNCRYPVVSISTGASSAKKQILENLKYLLGFKYVVLCFDNDEAGIKAREQCIPILDPGKVKYIELPLKDANDMLKAGMNKELFEILFSAKDIVVDSVVTMEDIVDKIKIRPRMGLSWPWRSMTEITYGFQLGEIIVVVAAPAIGKTEIVKDIMFHFMEKEDFNIGLFSFEQNPEDTARRLVGAKLNKKLHIPSDWWEDKEIHEAAMSMNNRVFFYDKAGSMDIDDLFYSIRYEAKAKNVKLFILDNLKALDIANDNQKASDFMNRLKSVMKELNTTMILLSHVSKSQYNYSTYVTTSPKDPEKYNKRTAEENSALVNKPGLEWETGRMPTISNIEGSNIVAALANYVFAFARHRTSEDVIVKRTLIGKCLKARLDSQQDGKKFYLYYTDQGRLEEVNQQTKPLDEIKSNLI